jgi:DNA-binding response OmpR family regulator
MNCNTLVPVKALSLSGKKSSEPSKLNLRCRILVAEDDHVIRRLMSLFLMDEKFEVEAVSDGEQAWEALNQDDYDLLVTDNDMPRLTGINLITRIRKAGIRLPVIIASGTFSPESVPAYTDLNISAVITKPFGRLELLKAVRNALFSSSGPIPNQTP